MSSLRGVVFSVRTFLSTFVIAACLTASAAYGQTNEFTYQGSLKTSGAAANGSHDFEFALFDAPTDGSQVGSTLTRLNVDVVDGVFSVKLDFGAQFPGDPRFLEIRVRQSGSGGFTPLAPRQSLDSAPYAVRSTSAANATNAVNSQFLAGQPATNYVLANDPRLNSIRNQTTLQSGASFNISGNGTLGGTLTAGSINVPSGGTINIAGVPIISIGGHPDNFTALVGRGAGVNNSGIFNSFFGALSGTANTFGASNSFFGYFAGGNNTTGNSNAFFGTRSGEGNVTGSENAFFGRGAGEVNSSGNRNAFFGFRAGLVNQTGSFNTAVGHASDFGASNLNFATAIGAAARVNASDTIVLGKIAGTYEGVERVADRVVVPGSFTTVGIISTSTQYNVGANHVLSAPGTGNIFLGQGTGGGKNFTGSGNTFLGFSTGSSTTTGSGNTFVGSTAGTANFGGSSNTLLGHLTDLESDALTFASAIGAGAKAKVNNSVVLGRALDTVFIPGGLNVSGAFSGTFTVSAANLTGVVAVANGGTGISSPGAAGNFLRSNGTIWQSAPFSAADVPAGSANYIHNTISQQASSNFNISGNGTVGGTLTAGTVNAATISGNTVNSATQYNIGGNRVLSTAGTNNIFVGANTGSGGTSNAFVGASAGNANSSGASNAFFGNAAGQATTTGGSNTFLGAGTGSANTTGSLNTLVGHGANVGSANLTNATALGAGAVVTANNTVVLGRNADAVQVPGNLTVSGTLTANLPGGSTSYIQNTTTQQASSNFNISGNGVVGGTLNVGGGLTVGSFTLPGAISGVLGAGNGGTGVTGPGAAGNFLRSTGSAWASSPLLATDIIGGSPNYIQNSSTQQASSNFNITGTGTAGIFNAGTQYNIAGSRVLGTAGSNNLFAGVGAGTASTGTGNAFFGAAAGSGNTNGDSNTFVGASAGTTNTTGNNNTLLGSSASVASGNLSFATAIGSGAQVSNNNSVVLGRGADTVRIPGNLIVSGTFNGPVAAGSPNYIQNTQTQQSSSHFNISGSGVVGTTLNVGGALTVGSFTIPSTVNGTLGMANGGTGLNAAGNAGNVLRSNGSVWASSPLQASDIPSLGGIYIQNNTAPQAGANFNIAGTGTAGIFTAGTQFNIGANRILSNGGTANLFAGQNAGANNTGNNNSFIGFDAGAATTTGNGNTFLGANAGEANTTGGSNTAIGSNADFGSGGLLFATAIGSRAVVNANDTIVIGKPAGTYFTIARPADNVILPGALNVGGFVTVPTLGATGSTPLCRNAQNQISTCAASLDSTTGMASLRSGEGEFVKASYERNAGGVLNVVREQQAQIDSLQKEIVERKAAQKLQQERLDKQQAEIDALKKLVCAQNPGAGICK